ncbi:HAD-IIA family hydrolase [bacterium]|nr:HAD-IIA family hydrolase [bacterium]
MTGRSIYLIDIEGVLVVDKRYEPVPGAVAWLRDLDARGIRWRLVSNNTTHTPDDLVAALARAGFAVSAEHLVGALGTGAAMLRERGWRDIGWLGHGGLVGWLGDQGLRPVAPDAPDCDAVVLGVGPDLELGDLDRALRWLKRGAALMCLHRNRFWLDEAGRARLGPGSLAAALTTAVPGAPVVTAGKPEPAVYRAALDSLGGSAAEALFISDDPFTDLAGARRLGMATVLVLSGKYPDASVLDELPVDQRPDRVIARADQL